MDWILFELQVFLSHQSASPYFTEEVLLLTVPISCVPEVVTLVMAFCFALGSPELASLSRVDDTSSHDLRSSRERPWVLDCSRFQDWRNCAMPWPVPTLAPLESEKSVLLKKETRSQEDRPKGGAPPSYERGSCLVPQ